MKLKFLLPVLAMIFAIGMSFTTVERSNDPSTDYILVDGSFEPINMEVNCTPQNNPCRVQIEQNGDIYELYDSADPTSLKEGTGGVTRLWK